MQQLKIFYVYQVKQGRMVNIDKTMLKECKKGVIETQMEFYDTLFPALFRTAVRIVGDGAGAEDVVQESFLKIFDRIDKYIDNPPSIEYALRRIVINASIDELRRRKVQFVELQDTNIPLDDANDQQSAIQVEQIKAAIEKLAPGFKLVITLRLFENMEFSDIAARLGIGESSVRSQYIRAKQKIRELI